MAISIFPDYDNLWKNISTESRHKRRYSVILNKSGQTGSVSMREGSMSYSKVGKIRDFASTPAPSRSWQVVLHTILISACFGFVSAVVLGMVP